MKKLSNYFLGALILGFAGTQYWGARAELSPEEVQRKVSRGEAVLIDVRESDEVREEYIQTAWWVPLSQLESQPENLIKKLPKEIWDKEIYTYCRSGMRSGKARKILQKFGFKKVFNAGAIRSLKKSSLPISKGLPNCCG